MKIVQKSENQENSKKEKDTRQHTTSYYYTKDEGTIAFVPGLLPSPIMSVSTRPKRTFKILNDDEVQTAEPSLTSGSQQNEQQSSSNTTPLPQPMVDPFIPTSLNWNTPQHTPFEPQEGPAPISARLDWEFQSTEGDAQQELAPRPESPLAVTEQPLPRCPKPVGAPLSDQEVALVWQNKRQKYFIRTGQDILDVVKLHEILKPTHFVKGLFDHVLER